MCISLLGDGVLDRGAGERIDSDAANAVLRAAWHAAPRRGMLALGGYNIAADTPDAPIAVSTNREQFSAGISQWVVSAHEAAPYAGNWQIQVNVNCVG
jgi:hypothetical protein